MWCVTPCGGGFAMLEVFVISGNAPRMSANPEAGRMFLMPSDIWFVATPFTTRRVLLSMRHRWCTLTSRSKCDKKSEPRRGYVTSAMVKIHRKILRSPKSKVTERIP